MNFSHACRSSRWIARLASTASMALAGLSLTFAAHAQSGQTIEGVFTSANSAPDWTLSGSRMGSIAMTPSVDGSGWLRLTPATAFALGRVQANAKIASGVPIHLEFDYLQWGGRYDGLSIYFADASVTTAGRGGVEGGGLGYCGMAGAYLGIGIDDGGNFTAAGCGVKKGFSGGTPNVGMANVVGVRGPQSSNYDYLGRFELKDSQAWCVTNCTDRSQATNGLRHVVLDMTPRTPAGSGYKLSMKVNDRDVLKDVDYPYAVPAELTMGLVGATGAYGANHEIRDVKLSARGGVVTTNCLNGILQDGTCKPIPNALANWLTYVLFRRFADLVSPSNFIDDEWSQPRFQDPWTFGQETLSRQECEQLAFTTPRTRPGSPVNQIVVISKQDMPITTLDLNLDMTFTQRGAVDFELSYSTDHSLTWQTPPAGLVSNNKKIMRVINLPKTEILTNISLLICKTANNLPGSLTEVLAWEKK